MKYAVVLESVAVTAIALVLALAAAEDSVDIHFIYHVFMRLEDSFVSSTHLKLFVGSIGLNRYI